MATSDDKNVPWLNGSKSGTVYYTLNGVRVARGIGKNNGAPSLKQQTSRQATMITSAFLGEVMSYIKIGFESVGRLTKTNQQNQAFSYNRKNAITGTYPDVMLDYTRALLSMGTKPLPDALKTFIAPDGLMITWDTNLSVADALWDDQVIVMAYFPELKNSVFLSGGARRFQGAENVPLTGIKRSNIFHVFFSMISNDRTTVSNSQYLGQLTW